MKLPKIKIIMPIASVLTCLFYFFGTPGFELPPVNRKQSSDENVDLIRTQKSFSSIRIDSFESLTNQCKNVFLNVTKRVEKSTKVENHKLNLKFPREKTLSCENFFTQRSRFYSYSKPVTQFEKKFSVAFSVIVYRNFDQVEQLLAAVYNDHNFYCFHVDTKSDELFREKVRFSSRSK